MVDTKNDTMRQDNAGAIGWDLAHAAGTLN
jgi:kynureninase